MKPTEYITTDRRGHAAHDLELEAMHDPFLAEALEGFTAAWGDHAQAVEHLQQRLAARTARARRVIWRRIAIAAALIAAVATTTLLILHQPAVPVDYPAVAVTAPPTQPDGDLPQPPATAAETTATAESFPTTTPEPEKPADTPTSGTQDQNRSERTTEPAADFEPITEFNDEQRDINQITGIGYNKFPKNKITGSIGGRQSPKEALQQATGPLNSRQFRGATADEAQATTTGGGGGLAVTEPEVRPEQILAATETPPHFQGGGIEAFRAWVELRTYALPISLSSGIPRPAIVAFVIDTLGNLGDIQVLSTPDKSLAREVVRILESSPHWDPGRQLGHKVPIKYTLSIRFREAQTTSSLILPSGETPLPKGGTHPARFQNGDAQSFQAWAQKQMNTPRSLGRKGVGGKVVARFKIDTTGHLTAVEIGASPHEQLTREVERVLHSSPPWEPARWGGMPVPDQIVTEFNFPAAK